MANRDYIPTRSGRHTGSAAFIRKASLLVLAGLAWPLFAAAHPFEDGGSLYAAASGQGSQRVFYIERNKNRNLVQYAVRFNQSDCSPASDEPVFGYWRDIEEGPNVTSPIKWYEKRAYGFESQSVSGKTILLKLKALPARTIRIEIKKEGNRCVAKSRLTINGAQGFLRQVYVFAEEGLVLPTVKWIEIRGTGAAGASVKERIVVD